MTPTVWPPCVPAAAAAPPLVPPPGAAPAPARASLAPGWPLALGSLAWAGIWLATLAALALAPPVDDIEQLTWVRSLQWGYYKHPPLPTWLLWGPEQLFGPTPWLTYGLGAACTLGALAMLWMLLAPLRGRTYATVALLAGLCITYYNRQLNFYNHEVVLMLLSSASAWLCWRAFATGQRRWWLALGVVLGLGALTKYQVVVTLASVAVFALHQRFWRSTAHRQGALAACLIALLMFVPHVEWLRTHDFGPVRYALGSSLGAGLSMLGRAGQAGHWLLDQLLNRALPALLLVAAAVATARQRAPGAAAADRPPADGSRALLWAWGAVPLAFMPAMALLAGADLPLHWGAPFLLFAVPAAMELLPRDTWDRVALKPVLRAFVLLQLLLLATLALTSVRGPFGSRVHGWHRFDSQALARSVAAAARQQLGGPIRLVVGDPATAGALSLALPEHPLVMIDGRLDLSPWVAPDLLARCGALQIGHLPPGPAALHHRRLHPHRAHAERLGFGLPDHGWPGGQPVGAAFPRLQWRVIPRTPGAAACPAP